MAINKVVFGDETLIDLTPTTAEAEDVAEGKVFMNRSGNLVQGTSTGGSNDYEELDNLPKINNVELKGNKTTSDLGIVIPTIPTNVSAFNNDAGYITSSSVPTKVSELDNDSGYITSSSLPTKTSQLDNDSGYITSASVPTKTSQLNNDSGFIDNTYHDSTKQDLITSSNKIDYSLVDNTPTIPVVPTNVSSFNNDAGYIDKDVNNLTNYSTTSTLQVNKALTKGIEYIIGTQQSATNLWTGTSTDTGCSSGAIYTGKVIIYHLPQAGSSTAATLNLTLPDGTTTGAKNVYRLATTTTTTNFASGCDILMVFDGTNWKVNAYVDTSGSNTIGYQLRTNSGIYYNGASTSIYRYQLLVENEEGKLCPFTSTSNSTKTTKTQLSPKYRIGGDMRYYSASTEITGGSEITKTSIWQQYHFDLRYSFNITTSTLTAGKPVYMKMSDNGDGTLSPVYSANSGGHPLVQDLPTTEDNYVYVFLGQAYSGYQMEMNIKHPMYEYKDGKIKLYIG